MVWYLKYISIKLSRVHARACACVCVFKESMRESKAIEPFSFLHIQEDTMLRILAVLLFLSDFETFYD